MNRSKVQSPAGDSAGTAKPKRQRGIWWVMKWSFLVFLVLVIATVLLNFRMGPGTGSPLVRVSRQTTYATSPLKPNGDVDYIAFVNQQYAVPADQNAMVGLIRVMGPKPEGVMLSPEFFQLLGIPPLPENGDYIEYFDSRLFPRTGKENIRTTLDGVELDNEMIYGIASEVPFSKGQLPIVDDWLESNERHLEALREAVRKPGYYAPYIGDTMIGVLLPHVQRMRSLARSLQASAMSRLGDGDVAGAIDDQIAILRLGRHVGSRGVLELLVGTAIEGIGQGSIAQTIYSGKCSAADLQRLARELDSLPAIPMMGKQHLNSERAMGLDFIINIGRYGPMPWTGDFSSIYGEPGSKSGLADRLFRSTVNWEVVCIETNGFYDRLEAQLEPDDLFRKAAQIRTIEPWLKALQAEVDSPSKIVGSVLAGRASRGRMIANRMAGLLMPAIQQVFDAGRRIAAQNGITRIAIALELYRLERGEYPGELTALVPEFLETLPLDPFTGELPVYFRDQGAPYQLYSLGPNETDDGGISMEEGQYPNVDFPAVPRIRTVQQWIANELKKE